ncbi:hypothetical protein [Streptomyces sp. SM12]|uniref:hypothetical protein n=1 Tax=Streptomyces sp. SM12 TaxID=1071602 RepID=UPI000CD4C93C|nr:hypothetical protein [Streptomyces sp. SM12]
MPPVVLSGLDPLRIEFQANHLSLVCPDCQTWTGVNDPAGRPQLVPHHNKQAGTVNPRRCESSWRTVNVDMAIGDWSRAQEERRQEAVATTATRRPTKVTKRSPGAPAPAVTQMQGEPITAESLYRRLLAHRAGCRSCIARNWCTDGLRLAGAYARLQQLAPQHQRNRELLREVQREETARTRRSAGRDRVRQWERVSPAVAGADAARRHSDHPVVTPHADIPT